MRASAVGPSLLLSGLVLAAAGGVPSDDEGPLDAVERERIATESAAWVERQVRVLERGDAAAVRALFVDDGRFAWFTDGVRRYRSPDDVVAGVQALAGARPRTTLSAVEAVVLSREHVSVHAEFAAVLPIPGADPVEFAGAITWLLERRRDDGGTEPWRVLLGHTSTPGGPPDAGDARDDGGTRRSAGGTYCLRRNATRSASSSSRP